VLNDCAVQPEKYFFLTVLIQIFRYPSQTHLLIVTIGLDERIDGPLFS